MRIRTQNYYKAFFTDSYKTIRFTTGHPITPELEDVAINNKCLANCTYCYINAEKTGVNFDNIVEKALEVYGKLSLNDRPFQIAIGGAGEPTLHPNFIDFIKAIRGLDIIPNYTTNGMHLTEEILKNTEKYCGGVALSYHPHIADKIFHNAIDKLKSIKTKLNIHIIIGDNNSLDTLSSLYNKYKNIVDYFVLLPYQSIGRAKKIETEDTWVKMFDYIVKNNKGKFAFGALFYDFIKSNKLPFEMSIYDPEKYSGYRVLDNNYKNLYKSSFRNTELKLYGKEK